MINKNDVIDAIFQDNLEFGIGTWPQQNVREKEKVPKLSTKEFCW